MREEILYEGQGWRDQRLVITKSIVSLGTKEYPVKRIRRGYAITSRLTGLGSCHFKLDLGPFYRLWHGSDPTIAVFRYDQAGEWPVAERDRLRSIEAALEIALGP